MELVPQQVIYSEAGTQVSANTPQLAPRVTQEGILVSWIVNHPESLQDLLLGGKTGGWRSHWRTPV